MDDHMMMLSCGDRSWIMNFMQALSLCQWRPGNNSLVHIITTHPPVLSQLQWCINTMQTHMATFSTDKDKNWQQPLSPPPEVTLNCHHLWQVGLGHLTMIWRKAMEWAKHVDGTEENSTMEANQSGTLHQEDTIGPERLEDWKNNTCSEEIQADWLSEQGDCRTTVLWALI